MLGSMASKLSRAREGPKAAVLAPRVAESQEHEKHYLDIHVPLARKLPGLKTYLTGKFRDMNGVKPSHHRAAILIFDSPQAAAAAIESEAGAKTRADSATFIADPRPLALEPYIIMPFDSKQVGRDYFASMAEFDINTGKERLEAADHEYLAVHTAIVRRMPGLRFCFTGRLVEARGVKPDRHRCAMGMYDNQAAQQASRTSPVAAEVVADEGGRFANKRVYQLDITVQI